MSNAISVQPTASGLPVADTTAATQDAIRASSDKGPTVAADDIEKRQTSIGDEDQKRHSDDGSEFKQAGVAKAEAVTKTWSRKTMWLTFALLYLVSIVDSLLGNVQGNLMPYVTSAFGQHGLLGITGIVSTILGGVITFSIAKAINIFGRMQGLIVMVIFIVLGMIMKATCQNVETYAAAQTIYWVGHIGLLLIITVTLADMTTLTNRTIMLGFNTTPMILSYFVGPIITQALVYPDPEHPLDVSEPGWRWGFGMFAIIILVATVPVTAIFILHELKAKKAGMLQARSYGNLFVEFDVVGIVLITAGASLLLLPFSIAPYMDGTWSNGGLISMFVLGPILLVIFGLWEKKYASIPLFPWKYLTDRTILGACLNNALMFASIFCWDLYYYSYLQVAHGMSITDSSYTLNALSFASAVLGVFIGLVIRWTGNVKYVGLAGVPFLVIGTALLVVFRTPGSSQAVLIVLQVLIGAGSGLFALTSQMAIMAAVDHNDIAVGLALQGLFGAIGAAVGMAIGSGIWNNLLPAKLLEYLPEDSKADYLTIFGDITVQLTAEGAVREAVDAAYGDMQHMMVIAGCAFTPFIVGSIFMWRNYNLKELDEERNTKKRGNIW